MTMAKVQEYLVSFSPAERSPDGRAYTVSISMMATGVSHTVLASTFEGAETEIRRLAREYGQTCSTYIRLKDKKARKPAGFDKWADRRCLRYIDFVPEQETAA
jgi:hypothetical protein